MESENNNKSVVKSIRIGEDTKQKLEKQLQELGLSQDVYFSKTISLMELENAKQNNILVADITALQSNLGAIEKAFINIAERTNSLLGNKDVEMQELSEKCKTMLFDKDNTIQNLKQELQEAAELKNLFKKENEDVQHEIEELNKKHTADMKQYEDTIQTQKELINNINSTIAELKEKDKQYKLEIAKLGKEDSQLKEANKNLSADNTTLNATIKDLKAEITKLKETAEAQKRAQQLEVNTLIADKEKQDQSHKEELETLKEHLNIEKDKALLDLQKKHQEELIKINELYNNKVSNLLEKVEKLQDELK